MKWLINIMVAPIIKKIILNLYFLYLNDVGNNSYIEMCIMIPAIIPYNKPIVKLLTSGVKKRYANRAPSGSDKAEIRVYLKAFPLLLVA